MKKTSPIQLSTTVSIPAAGLTANASTRDLTNPFREAMWIDSINWTASAQVPVNEFWDLGGTIQTRIMIGRTELTRNRNNGFVPIWSFSSRINQNSFGIAGASGSAVYDQGQITFGGNEFRSSSYKWKLPRPLYVPPGMGLQSEFFRDANSAGLLAPVLVAVTYCGRYVDPREPTHHRIAVPLVSYFEAPGISGFFQSNQQDLMNPYETPLHVQRFLGTAWRFQAPNLFITESAYVAQTKIKDSTGYDVAKEFTPGNGSTMIDYLRRGWTFNKVLAPKQWFDVSLQAFSDSPFGLSNHDLSMIGWREEEF